MKQKMNKEKEEMNNLEERKDLQEECGPVPACCGSQTKIRSENEYKDLIHRLNRVEGQIRGIRRMLEQDAYCIDVLNQVSAANCALNSFTKVLLANHIRSCVVDDVREGNDEKLEELVRTLQKMMK